MRVAFDLDDTLDHEEIQKLLFLLLNDPHSEVFVLSAGRTSEERKRDQLHFLGIPYHVPLHKVPGMCPQEWATAKAEWIKEHEIDLFIEDRPDFCKAARTGSPDTVVLRVMGPKVTRSHDAIGKP